MRLPDVTIANDVSIVGEYDAEHEAAAGKPTRIAKKKRLVSGGTCPPDTRKPFNGSALGIEGNKA